MAVAWQRQNFLNDWAGLFIRHQPVDVGTQYAAVAKNIDFYGSAIGKRLGSQIVNGWSALAVAGWTNSPNATGVVDDASGFQVGDLVDWKNLDGTFGVAQVAAVNYLTNTLTLNAPAGSLPTANGAVWTVRATGIGRIDGLFHAVFRDRTEHLLAVGEGPALVEQVWDIWGTPVNVGASFAPALVPTRYPTTTVPVTWGGTSTGQFGTYETLVTELGGTVSGFPSALEPDIVQILHNGMTIYEGTIRGFFGPNVVLSGNAAQPPQAGDLVVFFPTRTFGDTRFAQGANVTHIASAAAENPVAGSSPVNPSVGFVTSLPAIQRTPPIKFTPAVTIQRHGIRAPTSLVVLTPLTTPAGLDGTYSYRQKFRNSITEQESEPGPVSGNVTVGGITGFGAVQVVGHGSPDPQVDKIRFYRTLANTSGAWYFAGEIDNPGGGLTASFTDVVIDAGLGPLMREFLDLPVANTCSQLVYWPQAARLVGIDAANQYVILSDGPEIGIDPVVQTSRGRVHVESFPADNIIFVNRDDGDPLVGLAAFYDSVLVFKQHSVWRILGTPPDIVIQPVLFRDDRSSVGAFGPKAIAVDQDEMAFQGEDGFYSISRAEDLATGFQSERLSRQIDDVWATRLNVRFKARTHVVYSRQRRQLRSFIPVDGSNEPNDIFLYQFDGTVTGQPHGWAEWTPPGIYGSPGGATPSVLTTASAVVRPGDGFAVAYYGRADGVVVKGDQPMGNDCGLAFDVEYETTWWAPAGPGQTSRGRALDTAWEADVFDAANPPVLQVNVDFGATPETVPMPITGTAGSPLALRGIVFALGEYHQLGFKERSPTSMYRLLVFSYHFQALATTVADRSGFVQMLT